MNQVKKYKKITLYLKVITVPLMFVLLIGFLIVILSDDHFGNDDLIAIIVFSLVTIILIGLFIYLDAFRYRIVDNHFGKVTEEDKEIAKDLIVYLDYLYQNEYEFLNHPKFQEYEDSCPVILKQITKGHKVYKGIMEPYFEIQHIISTMNKDEVAKYESYNNYLSRLVELFSRNQSDI